MSDDGLAAFLRARLDEDEAAANEIHRPRDCGSVDRDGEFDPDPIWCSCHYPARLLREAGAGRRILARYEDCLARMEDDDYPAGVARDQAREYEDFVLPNLAAAWSDHPDYDPDWEP